MIFEKIMQKGDSQFSREEKKQIKHILMQLRSKLVHPEKSKNRLMKINPV